jgi:hypothetical protein
VLEQYRLGVPKAATREEFAPPTSRRMVPAGELSATLSGAACCSPSLAPEEDPAERKGSS